MLQYKKFFSYTKKTALPYKKNIVIIIIISVISKLLELINPFFTGQLINAVIANRAEHFFVLVVAMISLFFVNLALSYLYTYLSNMVNGKISADIKNMIYGNLVYLQSKHFLAHEKGDYITLLQMDASKIGSFFLRFIRDGLEVVITGIISLCFMFYLSPMLSIFAFLSAPITLFINKIILPKLKKMEFGIMNQMDIYMTFLQDTIAGFFEIKSALQENKMIGKQKKLQEDLFEKTLCHQTLSAKSGLFMTSIGFLTNILVYIVGGNMMLQSMISVGFFMSFLLYSDMFNRSIYEIFQGVSDWQTTLVSIERYEKIIFHNEFDGEKIKNSSHIDFSLPLVISAKNIHFAYDSNKFVFQGIDFKVSSGDITAVVGANGIGKTTLFRLLNGLYFSDKGDIFFNDTHMDNAKRNITRKTVAYIPQDVFLFHDTVYNNLVFSAENITKDNVIAVCRVIGALPFIENLPYGFQTVVGDGGSLLSGGQRHLLALGRGILKGASILLFDEPTTHLDYSSSIHMLSVLKELSKDHVIMVATHNLTWIREIRKIMYLQDGKNCKQGTHTEMMSTYSSYRQLFNNKTD